MLDFTFHRPRTLKDATEALRGASEGKLLAGGQSLIPVMKLGLAAPGALVSLRDVAELRGIRRDGDRIAIGAMTTHADVASSGVVRDAIPALATLAGAIGDPHVRNRGTLGGSLAHADPAADHPAALIGLNAVVKTDRRTIAADDFFTGMFETALQPDEIIKAVHYAIPERAAYAKFAHPASRFAIAGVFVAKGAFGVRVAVTGAGPRIFRATAMEQALAAKFTPAALDGLAVGSDDLMGDADASAEYRAHLVGVMARRAMAACAP